MRRIATAVAASALIAVPASAQAATPATPIADEAPLTTLPAFSGATFKAKPITATKPSQNPWMATNGSSNLHNDSWMTDAYWRSGPLGKNLKQTTNNFGASLPGLCASLTFDSAGRLISVCPSALGTPTLRSLNPATLDEYASLSLPAREGPAPDNIFQDFTGGGYFYLDNEGHPVVSTNDRKIRIFGLNTAGDTWNTLATYDLTSVLDYGERLSSALPDWSGNIWFVSKAKGKVGWVNRTTGAVHSITLNEEIENSFMVGSDGVYIASDKAMYKFDAAGGAVHTVWRSANYSNIGVKKSGQVNAGTGTTPTMLPGSLVAITDNADPMNVVVYSSKTGKQTCKVPVFKQAISPTPTTGAKYASATENSLIGFGTSSKSSLIVENNFGYNLPYSVGGGQTSRPGVTRIDVSNSGKTCKVKWENKTVVAPTLVPKVSLGNGLLYLYTKANTAAGNKADAWFWTAVDASTGKVAWSKLAGNGLLPFNNNYAAIHIGPDNALYIGLIGGLARLSDGP